MNVQAVCDFDCKFTYASISCPGNVSDLLAFEESRLNEYVEALPIGIYVIGDNAYCDSEHCLTPFVGSAANSEEDAYNFFLSQLRIIIEMSFGLLVSKWRIFKRSLEIDLQHVPLLVLCAMKLHNFCITKRLSRDENDTVTPVEIDPYDLNSVLGYLPSDGTIRVGSNSIIKQLIVEEIRSKNYMRPAANIERRSQQD